MTVESKKKNKKDLKVVGKPVKGADKPKKESKQPVYEAYCFKDQSHQKFKGVTQVIQFKSGQKMRTGQCSNCNGPMSVMVAAVTKADHVESDEEYDARIAKRTAKRDAGVKDAHEKERRANPGVKNKSKKVEDKLVLKKVKKDKKKKAKDEEVEVVKPKKKKVKAVEDEPKAKKKKKTKK